jgi:hypothetical protein
MDIEGEIMEVNDELVPVTIEGNSNIDGLTPSYQSYGPPLIAHDYSMKVLTKKGEMVIHLTAELFQIISEKLSNTEKNIRLSCEKILWINKINAKSILSEV